MNTTATEPKEYTANEAQAYAKQRGHNTRFFVNCYGHTIYYTLAPTWCTPTGKAKGFPRSTVVKA